MNSSAPTPTEEIPPRCRYPFLLLHGLFGFEKRRLGPLELTYFRNVAPYLEAGGNQVFTTSVNPVQTIDYRAQQIRAFVDSHPVLARGPFNIIAHSMGGLDARRLATFPGFADRMRCLCTIASPHRGSALADLAEKVPGVRGVVRRWMPGVHDLTEGAMRTFNNRTPDAAGVVYGSVTVRSTFRSCSPWMWSTRAYLIRRSGPNDGQVSTASAAWGEVLEEVEGDHLSVIGLAGPGMPSRGNRHLALYGRIARWAALRGG